jgi:N-acylneuraminate cytidylyltransferase
MPAPACLVPARGGSKRFPRKNIAPLHGKPVLAYAVGAALRAGIFADVWVSTDDAEIAAVAAEHGARVHDRPPALAADDATVVDVALDFAGWLADRGDEADVLAIVLPTAALLSAEDLVGGWHRLRDGAADFVMAVTTYLESPFQALQEVDGYLRPYFGRQYLRRSQALPAVVVDAGSFYFARLEALRRERTLYGARLAGYPIPRERSIDIDEPYHLTIAAALLEEASRR